MAKGKSGTATAVQTRRRGEQPRPLRLPPSRCIFGLPPQANARRAHPIVNPSLRTSTPSAGLAVTSATGRVPTARGQETEHEASGAVTSAAAPMSAPRQRCFRLARQRRPPSTPILPSPRSAPCARRWRSRPERKIRHERLRPQVVGGSSLRSASISGSGSHASQNRARSQRPSSAAERSASIAPAPRSRASSSRSAT